MMDRTAFYAALRQRSSAVFGTSLSQGQVNGCEVLLNEAESLGIASNQLAYVLATAAWETARTMQPIEEYGKGKGRPYGKPDGPYGKVYYGRGFVQLTWLANYQNAGEKLGVNLVKFPEKAMEPKIAAEIILRGMLEGWFTGKKLDDYISGDKADYVGARRIVNGTDKASQIAAYAKDFEAALSAAEYVGKLVNRNQPQTPASAQTPPAAPQQPAQPKPAPTPAATYKERNLFWRIVYAVLKFIFRRN
jgi:hypothetical protein